jgi:hypothetical protein
MSDSSVENPFPIPPQFQSLMNSKKPLSTNQTNQTNQTNDQLTQQLTNALGNIHCDETCQKNKKQSALRKSYMDATEANGSSAQTLASTEKNYYIEKYGYSAYIKMITKRNTKTGNDAVEEIRDSLGREIELTDNMIDTYAKMKKGNKHIHKLDSFVKKRADKMRKKSKYDIEKADTATRKAYYENQYISKKRSRYNIMWWIYYISLIISVLYVAFNPPYNIKYAILLVLFILYPIFIGKIVDAITYLFEYIFHTIYWAFA